MTLHRFHGGLRLAGEKAALGERSVQRCSMPESLVIPLLQHAGDACEPCVALGEQVSRGQVIGAARSRSAVPVHAPASGQVVAIESRKLPHPSGLSGLCIVLRSDAEQRDAQVAPRIDWQHSDRDALIERILLAGIVGLGGAAFPTAAKIAVPRSTLILNGAECEPFIACDERLLRDRAADVIQGGRVLGRAVAAERIVLAIEDSMPAALAAARQAVGAATDIEVMAVPTIYPAGGERQLIRVLTGLEVPRGGLPRDVGVVVFNVATAAAVWAAVDRGEMLTSRIVTVTGAGVRRPGNFEAPIGTPIAHLIEQAGGYTDAAARLLLGGPLMGLSLPDDGYPIVKGSNCVLVLGADDIHDPVAELPCIRCGDCARACPAQLLPQQLLAFERAEHWQRLEQHGLFDCIECGCCDLVCPSHIPLVEHFRFGKSALRWREHDSAAANAAKQRFDARHLRIARDAAERAEKQAARRAAGSGAVQAALQRAHVASGQVASEQVASEQVAADQVADPVVADRPAQVDAHRQPTSAAE